MRRTFALVVTVLALGAGAVACSPPPGSASLSLDFSTVWGGVVDRDGQGTGFAACQTGRCDSSKINLDTASGRLSIVSTPGNNTGSTNTQVNALELNVDASALRFAVQSRVLGLADLTKQYQQKAIYFGPDQDNYFKVEVEYGTNGRVSMTAGFEQSGTFRVIAGPTALTSPGSIASLDLRIVGDPTTGLLQGAYRTSPTAAFSNIGGPVSPGAAAGAWFNDAAKAGLLVSNTAPSGTTAPSFTAVFDFFRVDAA